MAKDSKVNDNNANQEDTRQKEIPINKYSIYEIKSAIDTKITEVKITKKLKNLIKKVFRKPQFYRKSFP